MRDQAAAFPVDDFAKRFWNELEDDFNTPQAWAVLFELIKESNKFIDNHKLSQCDAQKMLDFVTRLNDIFGILPTQEQITPADIQDLAEQREQARSRQDYKEADRLREQIKQMGWVVEDIPHGFRLNPNNQETRTKQIPNSNF